MMRTMKKILFILLLFTGAMGRLQAQDLSRYEKHWFIQYGDTMPYRILLPKDFNPVKQYPLVFFLHGRGESGTDNEKQLVHGATIFLRDSVREQFPAIVVFPQCPANDYWSNVQAVAVGAKNGKRDFYFVKDGDPTDAMRLLVSLVGNIMERYPVNKQQVYVMGLSMGGMGTFELVRRMPGLFAAAAPICGGAHPATALSLKNTHWWIFHGDKDDVVLPVYSAQMAAALQQVGAKVQFTRYPNANHNSWDPAFAEPGLLPWLFAQKKRK
jgi:predicted peptidase